MSKGGTIGQSETPRMGWASRPDPTRRRFSVPNAYLLEMKDQNGHHFLADFAQAVRDNWALVGILAAAIYGYSEIRSSSSYVTGAIQSTNSRISSLTSAVSDSNRVMEERVRRLEDDVLRMKTQLENDRK